MENSELNRIMTLLKVSSSLSSIELPALAFGALALIPGLIDEAMVGVGALAVIIAIACGRHFLVKNRDRYLEALEEAFQNKSISEDERDSSIKALNTLSIAGGKQ